MASKLKIKMGHIEFEYEGDAKFDKDAIKDLFTHLESLVGVTPAAAFETATTGPSEQAVSKAIATNSDSELSNLAANTVAARLDVKTGSDLAIAAAATLQISQGIESFTRKQLLETMQSAKTYYKASMGSNLTKAIDVLISAKRINALSNSEMSLSAAEIATLKGKLLAG